MDMIHLDVKGKVFKITFNPKKKRKYQVGCYL